MDLVNEVDFCDPEIKGELPVVVYSSISCKPNGELIYLINIEPINNARGMNIEVFSSENFYMKGQIESSNGRLNIFSFRCEIEKRYFIKIITEEFRDDEDCEVMIVNRLEEDNKVDFIFYGFYQFENTILTCLKSNDSLSENNEVNNVLFENNEVNNRNIHLIIEDKVPEYGFQSTSIATLMNQNNIQQILNMDSEDDEDENGTNIITNSTVTSIEDTDEDHDEEDEENDEEENDEEDEENDEEDEENDEEDGKNKEDITPINDEDNTEENNIKMLASMKD